MKLPMVYLSYSIILLGLFFYSFFLLDPNITFFVHPIWEIFRDGAVAIGYHNRALSWSMYVVLILGLFLFHGILIVAKKKTHPLLVAGIVLAIVFLSYPMLSKDFFNYMFDARIVTFYDKNPYLYRALDFPSDSWLRFMHWTHRTYAYGPIFLPITLIPSALSQGIFLLNFIFFKILFACSYLFSVYFLTKMRRSWGLFFATHPLIIIDGLINAHNDLIAIFLGIAGIYFLKNKRKILARVLLLFSAGIKYITIPLLAWTNKSNIGKVFVTLGLIFSVLYLSYSREVQSWYFLNFAILIPFSYSFIRKCWLFSLGLLLSYYPFIRLGDWEMIQYKHTIIYIFIALNIIYYIYIYRNRIKSILEQ